MSSNYEYFIVLTDGECVPLDAETMKLLEDINIDGNDPVDSINNYAYYEEIENVQ